MIVINVELHSAITGEVSRLGKAVICNDGTGSMTRGNYKMKLYGKTDSLMRECALTNWPRKAKHVWQLIAAMLPLMYVR